MHFKDIVCIMPSHEFSAKAKMLTCPLHGSKFNIETGKSIGPLIANDLKTYNVKIEDNEVYLVIEDSVQIF